MTVYQEESKNWPIQKQSFLLILWNQNSLGRYFFNLLLPSNGYVSIPIGDYLFLLAMYVLSVTCRINFPLPSNTFTILISLVICYITWRMPLRKPESLYLSIYVPLVFTSHMAHICIFSYWFVDEQVDDKYQYMCENKDNKVHGWICLDPPVGFWQITPSNEFRTGGPLKQDLTSHVSPVTLAVCQQ